jgi:excisionase family DNA binding protein
MINDYGIGAEESDRSALNDLAEALDSSGAPVGLRIGKDEALELPQSAKEALARVAAYLANAHFVSIQPVDELLTTQEAADFVGVSRPYLIEKLLGFEDGQIPYVMRAPGSSHRRVKLADLVAFRERQALETAAYGRGVLQDARSAILKAQSSSPGVEAGASAGASA